jgi:hypothetical protein
MKQHYILAMIVVIIGLLWIGSEVFKTTTMTEGFTTGNVNLNMCPLWAPQLQTAKGNTDCCEGTLLDGKCNGKTFCTLSPPHDGIESCLIAWRKYYADQSVKQCPSTMRNYYEDVKRRGGVKGCSAATTKEDGSGPTNATAAQCRVYPTEKENRENLDSCFIEKERLKIQCPRLDNFRSQVDKTSFNDGTGNKFGSFVCAYTNNIGARNSCNDEKSLLSLWDRQNPNWRTSLGSRGKLLQLNEVSCKTFLAREAEKRRVEELRRRAEEERRRREEQANRFRGFFSRFRQQSQNAMNRIRQAAEQARRKAEQERQAAQRRLREMQDRLRRCVR